LPTFRFSTSTESFSLPSWAAGKVSARWARLREDGQSLGVVELKGAHGGLEKVLLPVLNTTELELAARVRSTGTSDASVFMKNGAELEYVTTALPNVSVGTEFTTLTLDPLQEAFYRGAFSPERAALIGFGVGESSVLHVDAIWFQPRSHRFEGDASLDGFERTPALEASITAGEERVLALSGEGELFWKFSEPLNLSELVVRVRGRVKSGSAQLDVFVRDTRGREGSSLPFTLTRTEWDERTVTVAAPERSFGKPNDATRSAVVGLRVRGDLLVQEMGFALGPDPVEP
jgi:hypothetical protein